MTINLSHLAFWSFLIWLGVSAWLGMKIIHDQAQALNEMDDRIRRILEKTEGKRDDG